MPGMYGTHGWVIMAGYSYCDMPGMYGTHGWVIMAGYSYCDMPGMYGTHGWVIMALYNKVILIVTCLVCMVYMGGSSWPFIIRLFLL